ncbi:MAG: SatD family protein [Candidatus Limnocylindrales bacterium]
MDAVQGLVLFGDVIGSRKDRPGSTAWLRDLVSELDEAYGDQRLALFGFTQGDELQGLLDPDADPLVAVLRAALGPAARPIRWACIAGPVDAGEGPATQRTGPAFLAARDAIDAARAGHDHLVIRTGRPEADELLAGMTPALADLLEGLTARQRAVARLALIDGLRQSEVAERLGVRRATISVSFGRARVQSLGRLVAAMRKVYSSAVAPAGDDASTGAKERTS